jgi:hypothetical protein
MDIVKLFIFQWIDKKHLNVIFIEVLMGWNSHAIL